MSSVNCVSTRREWSSNRHQGASCAGSYKNVHFARSRSYESELGSVPRKCRHDLTSSSSSPRTCRCRTQNSTPAASSLPTMRGARSTGIASREPGSHLNTSTLCNEHVPVRPSVSFLAHVPYACWAWKTSGMLYVAPHQCRAHRVAKRCSGRPISPSTVKVPASVLKLLAMTAWTHRGASRKQPVFHAAPPPCR